MGESIPKNHYIYWVSYHWKSAYSTGFGGGRIFSTARAGSLEWIEGVRYWIEDQYSFRAVVIVNWKRLKDDEVWDAED